MPFDSAAAGINQRLAEGLGLAGIAPLVASAGDPLVGAGRITTVGSGQEHAYSGDTRGKLRGLMWERAVSHSIRPDGFDGFVLPYQQLLALAERDGTLDPSQFVAFAPDEAFDGSSRCRRE